MLYKRKSTSKKLLPFVVVVVVDCQVDFDVDNVQRRELVNLYGV